MVRVRFAPSPTGSLHLGNVRAALFNYLFARQKKGSFIVRIEDTDKERNIAGADLKIVQDLQWLGLEYDEGPQKGGDYGPYLQSERANFYQEKLDELIKNQKVYRCFCSAEELGKKRKEQAARKQPPRYDRTCLDLSDDMIKNKLKKNNPFMWRLRLNEDAVVEINDCARGIIRFELANFSDPALTRPDGSCTFMFANFVDDWLMNITHVIRGEDHLSNSAIQGALFDAFAVKLPTFWHLSFLCNQDGEKLSKREGGASLDDFRDSGFLPQALCNYLAIIGMSVGNEVQSLEELSRSLDFDSIHATGPIRFDDEKLRWLNHKWMQRLSAQELMPHVETFLNKELPESLNVSEKERLWLLEKLKGDLTLCSDVPGALEFYFKPPKISPAVLEKEYGKDVVSKVIKLLGDRKDAFDVGILKMAASEAGIKPRELWGSIRYFLTGVFSGVSIKDLSEILGQKEIQSRIAIALDQF